MDIVPIILPLIKEYSMTYGLWQTTLAVALIIIAWRLPNILAVLRDWIKNDNKK